MTLLLHWQVHLGTVTSIVGQCPGQQRKDGFPNATQKATGLGRREAFPGFLFVHGHLLFHFKGLFTSLLGTVIKNEGFLPSVTSFLAETTEII